jgi:transcriptional regulator with XRE-family HTH domain
MAVATATKIRALAEDLQTQSAVADLLGVSRSQVTRWLQGAGIDPLNAERVDLLEFTLANLLRLYEPDAARAWLFGLNPHLGDRRPIDLIRMRRAEELLGAIRAERAEAFA